MLAPAPRDTDTPSALERLRSLCDPGTLQLIRTAVRSRHLGDRARAGDGVLAGTGLAGGRPVFCYAQDSGYVGGSLGEAHAETIVRLLRMAARAQAPVVGFVSSGGARMQEGVAALGGYGRIFRETVLLSGKVPQITVVTGVSAGGGAYSPALTDWIVMTRGSTMFLTGPGVVRDALGEDVTGEELGGTRIHERNGVCQFVAASEEAATVVVRQLLGYLGGVAAAPRPPLDPDPSAFVPAEPRRVYDVRDVIRCLVDGGELLEVAPGWARNLVTCFARIDGRPVGVIANQPRHLAGVLDAETSQKGARFVSKCDAFGVPLVTLVDTPGYMPGTRQEQAGVIRFGATLVESFAAATVPRVTVVLRKAFGGAFITMNSKDLGADFVFAWPDAQIGVMGAKPAVGIIHRRQLAVADDLEGARHELEASYARDHLRAEVAAQQGFVDELIAPAQTRNRLVRALTTLSGSGSLGLVRGVSP